MVVSKNLPFIVVFIVFFLLTITTIAITQKYDEHSYGFGSYETFRTSPKFNMTQTTFSLDENENFNLTLRYYDLDEDTVLITNNITFGTISNINNFTWTPDSDDAGTYLIRFRVTDTNSWSGLTENLYNYVNITLNVNNVNRIPTYDSFSNFVIDENEELNFQFNITDEDNDELTVSVNNYPSGSTFNNESYVLLWKPDYSQNGTYELRLDIDDGTDLVSRDFNITVNNVNRVPQALYNPNHNINVSDNLSFTVNATDLDSEVLNYTTSFGKGVLNSTTGLFNWTPIMGDEGAHEIVFSVSDGIDTTDIPIYIVVGDGPNNPPSFLPYPTVVNGSENVTLLLDLNATDLDSDSLTFSTNATFGSIDPDSGLFNWTPSFNDSGNYLVEFQVSDGSDDTKSLIEFRINNTNRKPFLRLVHNYSLKSREQVLLNLNGSDIDDDSVSYFINDSRFVREDADSFIWRPSDNANGTFHFRAYIMDTYGAKFKRDFEVNVTKSIFKVLGDIDTLFTSSDYSIKLDNNSINTSYLNESSEIKIFEKNISLIRFKHNFSKSDLRLNFTFKDGFHNSRKYLFINDLQTENKSMRIVKNDNSSNGVCILDSPVNNLTYLVENCINYTCPFVNQSISCVDEGNSFLIEGLQHSGVLEVYIGNSSNSSDDSSSDNSSDDDSNDSGVRPSGGGGGGGSSSSTVEPTIVDQPSEFEEKYSEIMPPITDVKDEYMILVDGSDILQGNHTGNKKIVFTDKESDKNILEFYYDFSQSDLDLRGIVIDSNKDNGSNYIMINGLSLTGYTKTIRLEKSLDSSTVCIKDQDVYSVDEVSKDCDGEEEYLIPCDGSYNKGYDCIIEDGYYIVSGLKHSLVREYQENKEKKSTNEKIVEDKVSDDIKIEEVVSKDQEKGFDISLFIVGFIVLAILSAVLILVAKKHKPIPKQKEDEVKVYTEVKPTENEVSTEGSNRNTIPIVNTKQYFQAREYISTYKIHYSKDSLRERLISTGYVEKIVEKAIEDEYKLD